MICEKNKCTGCFACFNICPKKAIEMIEDDNGFIYPQINKEKCVDCGLCKKVCPALNKPETHEPKKCYAMQAKDSEKLKNSTSGGAATIFSEFILNNSGVVYGSAFEKGFKINHIRIDRIEELEKIKGSKYVHSYINDIFSQVKKDLTNGKKVLFTGTPCQVAGLKRYLMKEYENLYCIDIICHGVPSQRYLKDELAKDIKVEKISSLKFRKDDEFKIIAKTNDSILKIMDLEESMYYSGFMDGFFYRENCYNCIFANSKRVSDITIGDFWGIHEDCKLYKNKQKGLSVILPITEKGITLIEECKNNMLLEERKIEEAINGNSQLNNPTKMNKNYYKFKKTYVKKGFFKSYRKHRIFNIIKKQIKNKIKNNRFIYKIYTRLKGCIKK